MYPILEINYNLYPNLAKNIWHAQKAGHPQVLSYGTDRTSNRKAAMHYKVDYLRYEIVRIASRDEYPFACCIEGGSSAWVGHIPPKENAAQGGLIASFLKRNQIIPNSGEKSKFIVKVINYP